jgi:outer membrane lipoprotein LolB
LWLDNALISRVSSPIRLAFPGSIKTPPLIRACALALAALLCVQIVGCAALRGAREAPTVDPLQVTAFELEGRIHLRLPNDAFPGRVRWQHRTQDDELWFYSPLGSAVARLRQDESGALLVTSEGHEYRAADLHQLAFDVLGWDLPLQQLPFWVRGLPGPGEAERDVDNQGRTALIRQNGWEVAYLAWAPAGVTGLPSKLDLKGARLRMRLAVENWKVLDGPSQ